MMSYAEITQPKVYRDLDARRADDFALDMAMCSAMENAYDLGLEEDSEELFTEIARQVQGWLDNGREW